MSAWKPIGVTNPRVTGHQVAVAQQLLAGLRFDGKPTGFGTFHPGPIDEEAGPLFGHATREAKKMLGYPSDRINGVFGPRLYAFLSGTAQLPLSFRIRRRRRLQHKKDHPPIRQNMVRWCQWGIANEPQIHYVPVRPITFPPPKTLPLTTDCSGSTITFAKWSGVPPLAWNCFYNGDGYTGSVVAHARQLPESGVQPGDMVVFGPDTGHHMAVVIGMADGVQLASHGQETGPLAISLSQEASAQSSAGHPGVRFYSLL